METKSQLEKLDILFQIFKDEQEAISWHFIREMMEGKGVEVSDFEIERYINQLRSDNYIMQNSDGLFLIRIEGLLFNGYADKIAIRAAENIRLENLESELRENRRWTLYLTILIAVGTLVAAIYYCIEVCDKFSPVLHQKGLFWIWETIPKGKK